MTPSASAPCRQALNLNQDLGRTPKPADADVTTSVQAVEKLPVIEEVRRHGRAPPTALGGCRVASPEKVLQISHDGTITGRYTDMSTGMNAAICAKAVSVHIPSMDIGERIQKLMGEKGLNPYSLSLKAGLHEDTVRNIIRGATKEPSAVKLLKLARVLETSVEYMIDENAPTAGPTPTAKEIELPVRFQVGGNAWHEIQDIQAISLRTEIAERIEPYAAFPQWLEEVVGDSLDRMITPGALVHVVDASAMNYVPTHDDLVIVLRSKLGGALQQRTVQQVQLGPLGKIELWPRSHNARWGGPTAVYDAQAGVFDNDAQIVGKVVRAYMKFGKV